jgi:RNA polymerase sigma factor (sigma-70 family)
MDTASGIPLTAAPVAQTEVVGMSDRLEELYRSHHRRYVRLAAAIVGPQSAHDVVQDAFARVLAGKARWRGDGPIEAWMWRVVLTEASERHRRRGRRRRLIDRIGQTRSAESADAPAVDDALRQPLRMLPTRQRECVLLRYYGDMTYDQIAQVLGLAPGTVAALLSRAHAQLRSQIEKEDSQ